ncbi:MAG TPA: TlpA disulfide reductase family protein [Dinghuibacter sp.]|uniref:TlpA disulfide reductase family protein n=1 Tax=Dinghuibacter sp. TaxID=2024697 RepID=UPI002C4C70A2|nr:TlpA disulfide reductase family protein [Dinghuibacter sp.]HTJ13979.1 TlpA disulfide reductase family protein [Dinghuibacter sp.]
MLRTAFSRTKGAAIVGCLALGLLASCKQKGKEFTVKGELKGMPITIRKAYLVTSGLDGKPILILDSAIIKEGKFQLQGPKDEDLFRVMLGDPNGGPWMGVVNDAKEVTLSMDANKGGDYTVKGSPASDRFRTVLESLQEIMFQIHALKSDSTDPAGPVKADVITRQLYDTLAGVIRTDPSPVVASFALNFYAIGADHDAAEQSEINTSSYSVDTLNALAQGLQQRFPKDAIVSGQMAAVGKASGIPHVGSIAPELTLPDTAGKTFTLSSLRGKFVLVDFWASWCPPCRAENPNVVKAYNQFKNKNFAIVGVSLDQEKGPWLKAIHDDHLDWTQISDLQFWQSKAVDAYQFTGIPYNVLLDPQGHILAIGLRGDDLEAKLREVLP